MRMNQKQVEPLFDRKTPGLRISLSEFFWRLKKVADKYQWHMTASGKLRAVLTSTVNNPFSPSYCEQCPLQVVYGFQDEMQALPLYKPIALAADATDDYDGEFTDSNVRELRKLLLAAVGLEGSC